METSLSSLFLTILMSSMKMLSKSQKRRIRRQRLQSDNHRRRAPTKPSGDAVLLALRETIPIFPISTTRTDQLYYEHQLALNSTGGILSRYVFSANGVYDPNITGTGHQPMGFDQMMLFYEQAVCFRSRIRVNFACASATDGRVAIGLFPDTSAPASVSEFMENGLVVTDVVNGTGANASVHHFKSLELTCDVAKYFGRSKKELISSPEFYCTTAANPTEQVYFQVCQWNPSAATDINSFFDVIISYDVYYYEPRKDSASLIAERRNSTPVLISRTEEKVP